MPQSGRWAGLRCTSPFCLKHCPPHEHLTHAHMSTLAHEHHTHTHTHTGAYAQGCHSTEPDQAMQVGRAAAGVWPARSRDSLYVECAILATHGSISRHTSFWQCWEHIQGRSELKALVEVRWSTCTFPYRYFRYSGSFQPRDRIGPAGLQACLACDLSIHWICYS